MRLAWILLGSAFLIAAAPAPDLPKGEALPGGARWVAEMPDRWNGTLLLWSRGYSPNVGSPEAAPAALKAELLAAGYAIAGSDYGAAGWALEEAVPAQLATLAAFRQLHGPPKRTIAWGYSMGGLVTAALAERKPASISGAASFCASIGGAVGMMNMALDGAYAFKTLLAPTSEIRVVGIDDDMENGRRVGAALKEAMSTPGGRARVALAGVLGGLPGWTDPKTPQPDVSDYDGQVRQIADAFARGVFLPRVDQERRAGGSFSWNRGIDYRAQLALSGRTAFVVDLYRRAGLDLQADLARLNEGVRIKSAPPAVSYMLRNYTPNARPGVPLIAVQMVGDGLTSPSLQRAYADAAGPTNVRSLWVQQAGHCNFKPQTVLDALRFLESRLETKRWPVRPAGFVDHRPAPMLRPCIRGGRCR